MQSTCYVLLIADSLRYDVCREANLPFLKSQGEIHKAYSHGTYTWPSHMAMLAGHLPHCFEPVPLYNRYIQQLWRLGKGKGTGGAQYQQQPILSLLSGMSIVHGFRQKGFQTICSGGGTWFKHPIWSEWFDSFKYIQGAVQQTIWFLQVRKKEHFFLLINFSETHEPYSFGNRAFCMPPGYQMHKLGHGPLTKSDFSELRQRQKSAIEYLDPVIQQLCSQLPQGATVVFTADHGECFGEDGFFGHGFYHEKVLEVPLLIFQKR